MIHIETHGTSVHATLDAPSTRNALTDEMVAGLLGAIDQAEADPAVRALVICGAGGHFCAGGDFGRFRELMALPAPTTGPDPIATFNRAFGAMLERLHGATVATIAVVHGAAMGGGVGLAACCDFVLSDSKAQWATPEVTLGLPPAQIAPFVSARLGEGPALRLMLTGQRLDAAQALARGLVDEVHDGAALTQRLGILLGELARAEPGALRATKAILHRRRTEPMSASLDFAAAQFSASLHSGTAAEGIAALSARRPTRWVDQADALASANNQAHDGKPT